MGNIETAMKLYRLKSISGIEDYLEAATRGVHEKKLFLKISQYPPENNCAGDFLIKLQTFRPATLLKETLTQVFSCAYCEFLSFLRNIYERCF